MSEHAVSPHRALVPEHKCPRACSLTAWGTCARAQVSQSMQSHSMGHLCESTSVPEHAVSQHGALVSEHKCPGACVFTALALFPVTSLAPPARCTAHTTRRMHPPCICMCSGSWLIAMHATDVTEAPPQSITMHLERLEREAPAGALRFATVTIVKRSGTLARPLVSPMARQCLQT